MLNRVFFLLALSLITFSSIAQVVVLDPPEVASQDSVRIVFDASEGDAGLRGYTNDVWAHTGVHTNLGNWRYVVAEWGENVDKVKLTSIGDNLWELNIEPSIREFYGVPEDEIITHLAFVFRNNGGSRTGRDVGGGDIFISLTSIDIELSLPVKRWFLAEEGERIAIEASGSNCDSIKLYHDGDLVTEVAGEYLYLEIEAQPGGKHEVEVVASDSSYSASDSFSYAVRETFVLPDGVKDGINYIDDNTVILVFYAPEKDSVNVTGDFNNWEAGPGSLMKNTPDGNRFWIQIENLEAGKEYLFQYLVDGHLQIADPYTEKTSDYNDQFIKEETYPNLAMFPSNETIHATSILQTAQEHYEWKIKNFERPDQTNLVIYELLIRDFVEAHDYKTLIDTLNYLDNLGITAVELMPPSEFEGNVSWGYNPSFYFAPDKFYGPKDTFKAFIDACHERGIAVIIDMVLNHAYGRCPLVRLYWDDANNRPAENNPWFNVVSPNSVYSWGHDFNHESEETKAFVDSVNRFWLREYNVDGFRFDFTKGFTNTPGDGGSHDPARISILKRMADRIWEVEDDAYIILEHFAPQDEEIELADYGMMIWGNVNHSYRRVGSGNFLEWETNFGWGVYRERGFNDPHLVTYMESHDEERLIYEFLENGKDLNPDYHITDLPIALARAELCANFFIPIPGPKMIWMFGELGYDYSINYNGRIGRKPIRWDYLENENRERLYKVYSALNKLKSEHEVFKTNRFGHTLGGSIRKIRLVGDDMHVVVVGNFGIYANSGSPEFTHSGWWYEYWTSDSVYVENKDTLINFQPGEYRFYTDIKLDPPDITTGIDNLIVKKSSDMDLLIYPNPVTNRLSVANTSGVYENAEIRILDISGRMVKTRKIPYWAAGQAEFFNTIELTNGVYFVRVISDKGVATSRFIKKK